MHPRTRPIRVLVFAFTFSALAGGAADAAVQKFHMKTINITESPETSPPVRRIGADEPPAAPFDTAFVDDGIPGAPVLKKFRFKSRSTITVEAPGLANATIFLSNNFLEGPGTANVKPTTFTGTGHTAAASTIAWGVVTGWSITGAQYCNAEPPVICDLADQKDETTSDPAFHSDFYDLGTWTFHATGFTAAPFVHQFLSVSFGNNQRWLRGHFVNDATVPALPLAGLALLGASLAIGATAALRSRRG